LRILLIDNDAVALKSLESALEPSGYRCDGFTTPEDAVKAYALKRYDITITDIDMPGLNGIEVLKTIRSLNKEAKVIVVTANRDVETVIAALNAGACAFFTKPVDFSSLMGTLESICAVIEESKNDRDECHRLALEYERLRKAYKALRTFLEGRC
jgi:DNA-binding NtrC family response regulator